MKDNRECLDGGSRHTEYVIEVTQYHDPSDKFKHTVCRRYREFRALFDALKYAQSSSSSSFASFPSASLFRVDAKERKARQEGLTSFLHAVLTGVLTGTAYDLVMGFLAVSKTGVTVSIHEFLTRFDQSTKSSKMHYRIEVIDVAGERSRVDKRFSELHAFYLRHRACTLSMLNAFPTPVRANPLETDEHNARHRRYLLDCWLLEFNGLPLSPEARRDFFEFLNLDATGAPPEDTVVKLLPSTPEAGMRSPKATANTPSLSSSSSSSSSSSYSSSSSSSSAGKPPQSPPLPGSPTATMTMPPAAFATPAAAAAAAAEAASSKPKSPGSEEEDEDSGPNDDGDVSPTDEQDQGREEGEAGGVGGPKAAGAQKRRSSISRTIGKGFSAIGISKKKILAKARGSATSSLSASGGGGGAAASRPEIDPGLSRSHYITLVASKSLTPKECCHALHLASLASSDASDSVQLDDVKIVVTCALDFFDSPDVQLHAARYVSLVTTTTPNMDEEQIAGCASRVLRMCGPEVPGVPFLCFSMKKNLDDRAHVAMVIERLAFLVAAHPNLFMLELPQYADALFKKVQLMFPAGDPASRSLSELVATIKNKNTVQVPTFKV